MLSLVRIAVKEVGTLARERLSVISNAVKDSPSILVEVGLCLGVAGVVYKENWKENKLVGPVWPPLVWPPLASYATEFAYTTSLLRADRSATVDTPEFTNKHVGCFTRIMMTFVAKDSSLSADWFTELELSRKYFSHFGGKALAKAIWIEERGDAGGETRLNISGIVRGMRKVYEERKAQREQTWMAWAWRKLFGAGKEKGKEKGEGCTSEQAASFCASIKNNDFKQGLAYILAAELAERDRQYDAIMTRIRDDHDLMALVRSSLFGLLLGMGIDCWKELEKRGENVTKKAVFGRYRHKFVVVGSVMFLAPWVYNSLRYPRSIDRDCVEDMIFN